MGEQDNLYKTLFVAETASAEEIRKAYFILAKKFHDDLNRSAGQEERTFCENALKEVNAAYEVLSRPEKRAAYDRSRRQAQPAPQPDTYSNPNPRPAANTSAYQAPCQPHPVATPSRLEFGVMRPGETRGMSFFLANEGEPARTCRLSVGRELWIQVPPEIDKLPARIAVEVHIAAGAPAGRLTGAIQVQMDQVRMNIVVDGTVELPQAAAHPSRGGLFPGIIRDKPQGKREEPRPKIKCPFCGFENPPGSRTCRQCELPISREGLFCPYCGERLPSSACNCPGCGKFVTLW